MSAVINCHFVSVHFGLKILFPPARAPILQTFWILVFNPASVFQRSLNVQSADVPVFNLS